MPACLPDGSCVIVGSFVSSCVRALTTTSRSWPCPQEYEFGDLSIYLDRNVKDWVKDYTGKDEYQVGDLSREVDKRIKVAVNSFTGKEVRYLPYAACTCPWHAPPQTVVNRSGNRGLQSDAHALGAARCHFLPPIGWWPVICPWALPALLRRMSLVTFRASSTSGARCG